MRHPAKVSNILGYCKLFIEIPQKRLSWKFLTLIIVTIINIVTVHLFTAGKKGFTWFKKKKQVKVIAFKIQLKFQESSCGKVK